MKLKGFCTAKNTGPLSREATYRIAQNLYQICISQKAKYRTQKFTYQENNLIFRIGYVTK